MNAMKAVRLVAAVALSAVALWAVALWASPSSIPGIVPENPKGMAMMGKVVSVITYPDGRFYAGEIGTKSIEWREAELLVMEPHIVPHGRGIEMWPNGARAGHWSNGTFMAGSCYGTKSPPVVPDPSVYVPQSLVGAKWSLCGGGNAPFAPLR